MDENNPHVCKQMIEGHRQGFSMRAERAAIEREKAVADIKESLARMKEAVREYGSSFLENSEGNGWQKGGRGCVKRELPYIKEGLSYDHETEQLFGHFTIDCDRQALVSGVLAEDKDADMRWLMSEVIDGTEVIDAEATVLVRLDDSYDDASRSKALLDACVPYALFVLSETEGRCGCYACDCGKFIVEAARFLAIHGHDEQFETLLKVLGEGCV